MDPIDLLNLEIRYFCTKESCFVATNYAIAIVVFSILCTKTIARNFHRYIKLYLETIVLFAMHNCQQFEMWYCAFYIIFLA